MSRLLSNCQRVKYALWQTGFRDYLDEMWDRQIEADLASGKLNRLIAQDEEDMATNNVRESR
ncbi:MAG UNVERIFIED_CONTAM: hypothetical protein LVR29_34290 [Microcystis novacekii LVE1205-3]